MPENQPTNTDIMIKLSRMSDAQDAANKAIESHTKAIEAVGVRVLDLEKWQIAFKAAETALTNANLNKSVNPTNSSDSAYTTINKDLLKLIGQVVGVMSAVVALIYLFVTKL